MGRESAAKLIVEGKVRLAEADEQAAFYKRAARSLDVAEEERWRAKFNLP